MRLLTGPSEPPRNLYQPFNHSLSLEAQKSMRRAMKRLIQEEIKSYRDEILDFTKALVAIPTENPPRDSIFTMR